jgi:ammonia channel protein AmtB
LYSPSSLLIKIKIDDPVGAISVHGVCGALGTLLVGVLLLMADYFTVVDLKTRSSGYRSIFNCSMGNGRFFYSSFHLEENYGIK